MHARHPHVRSIEVKHGGLYPSDEPAALGLLFAIDRDDGERVTVVADPEWLRTLMEAIDNGFDMGSLEIPEDVMLPIAGRGWEEDWGDEERTQMGHMLWLFGEAGHDWTRLRAAVDALTGLRQ